MLVSESMNLSNGTTVLLVDRWIGATGCLLAGQTGTVPLYFTLGYSLSTANNLEQGYAENGLVCFFPRWPTVSVVHI